MKVGSYSPMKERSCWNSWCRFDPRFAALTSAFIILDMSILAILLYGWKVLVDVYWQPEKEAEGYNSVLSRRYYYGLQTSQFVLLSTHFVILFLTTILIVGVIKEKLHFIFSWLVGFVALICLETVCMIYSVVLIAHMHNGFDALVKAELGFFSSRFLVNGLAIYSIVGFYKELTAGRTWKPHINDLL
ncbi:uncharacterized protein LOC129587561 [Paramacrobiotus metropolitanus]|uniref:uncharacterized protein LOC129587561 n=1 Tax=Paramacrobiotus metropolitanus TaxID=2943436 RepID=UPI002445623E|nr:uncharacterized protein LOC129587561 [Paramacrobiotus metropolitanus]XP_055337336.1 uncharacterized protein LOC129587561 [Paramacrobiotus metropolitanus]XP_055337337.1 uncharacterized protein LOC129587561 [Paramacrobiotus metropolitanus]